MKFRPRVRGAYAPAQAGTGEDEEGRPVVLLFVPQWNEVVRRVAARQPPPPAETQWAFSREVQLPILFVRWEGGDELAVSFSPEMARQVLVWWEQRGRVDAVFSAAPVQEVEQAVLAGGQTTSAYLRVADVPFMTA